MERGGKSFTDPEIISEFYLNYKRFSCFSNTIYNGADSYGEPDDLRFFYEAPDCEMYEGIRKMEVFKHVVSQIHLKHVLLAQEIFSGHPDILRILKCHNKYYIDFSTWIRKVKVFYIKILTQNFIYDSMRSSGLELNEIELTLDLLFKLEECNLKCLDCNRSVLN